MKNLILTLLIGVTFQSFSQTKASYAKALDKIKQIVASDSVVNDKKSKSMILYGNVVFETSKLKLKSDRVFFDQKTNKIIAFGCQSFSFTDTVVTVNNFKHKILTYTIGDDTVYLE
ncbi:MAG: OstA-like protein [Pelobium sp.]